MDKIKNWIGNKSTAVVDKAKKFAGYEDIRKLSTETKEFAGTVLSPKKAIATARKETFKEAMKRLRVTESDLEKNYKNFALLCWISIGFAVFLLSLTIVCFINASFLQAFAGLSITSYCLASAFKFSFRAFQIRRQNLCSVQTWYESKSEWLPNPLN